MESTKTFFTARSLNTAQSNVCDPVLWGLRWAQLQAGLDHLHDKVDFFQELRLHVDKSRFENCGNFSHGGIVQAQAAHYQVENLSSAGCVATHFQKLFFWGAWLAHKPSEQQVLACHNSGCIGCRCADPEQMKADARNYSNTNASSNSKNKYLTKCLT